MTPDLLTWFVYDNYAAVSKKIKGVRFKRVFKLMKTFASERVLLWNY